MGKKLVAVFVTIACACTLCLALVGCGGGDPKANFTGAWELETIEDADLGTVDTATQMTLTLAGEGDAIFTLAEGKLTSDDGETTMIFAKADQAS